MSDFSGIQPPSGGGKFPPIQKGKDFFDQFPHCRDDGEKIELFVKTAQRQDAPLKALEELLKYRDQFYLTMGLQSFAYIGNQTIRTKLANLGYIDGLDEPLDEIYQLPNPDDYKCHSQRIFEKLSQEAQSGSELTRLSAAWTIQQLKYPQIVSARFLFKSVEDIQRQIISENLKRLTDRYLLSDPIRYKEFLDFWVYAPKNHLLQLLQSIPANSLKIVDDVLTRLGVAGFELVTQAYGLQKFVVEAGLRSADSLFRDRNYQDSETRERLSKALMPFLDNTDIDLRRLAAKTINEAGSWLKAEVRGKAAVISRDWNGNVIRLGEASVPFLLQALRGSLILDTRDHLGEQLKAIQCIGTIYAYNIDKKIRNLVEFLQHREESVRDATVSLLKQYLERLDQNSRYILTALDFQFRSPTVNFNFTTVAQVEGEITSTRQYQKEIERIFQNAILSCNKDATEVKNFLSLKQTEYNNLLSKHIQSLESHKSRLEWQAVEFLKEQKIETGRFVIDCIIMAIAIILFYIYHPLFLSLIEKVYFWFSSAIQNPYSIFVYIQHLPYFTQAIILGPIFLLVICIVICIITLLISSTSDSSHWFVQVINAYFLLSFVVPLALGIFAFFCGLLLSAIRFLAGDVTVITEITVFFQYVMSAIVGIIGAIIGIIICVITIKSLIFIPTYALKEILFMLGFIIRRISD